jgi:List-Bact-rpt repeat protein/putative pyrroloquinoline-quinone-binding quinoprotein
VRQAWRRSIGGLCLLAAVSASFACLIPAPAMAAPITASADALRTGWYPDEPQLTPQLLASGDFGARFDTPVQGQVYAQPLVDGGTVFVATEDNWIYGIDKRSGAILWERNVGEPWDSMDLGCKDLVPSVGITGTPVIDPTAGVAYFTSKSYASGGSGPAVWKMHAVEVATGSERPGFPVTIAGEAQNLAGVTFDPTRQLQRPALLLMNGIVYAGFGSHCDFTPYQGWIVGVSTSGKIETMWAAAPESVAVWQAGGGLVSDGEGQILFATGNSFGPTPPPTPTPPEDLGESVVRLDVQTPSDAHATDFFSPWDREALDNADHDLGSGGPLALPSQYFGTEAVPNLAVEAGKPPVVYLLDREHLGGFAQGPEEKNDVVQEIPILKAAFGSPSAWPGDGGYVYIPTLNWLEVLKYRESSLGMPELVLVGRPAEKNGFGSGSPMITSDETEGASAIVWYVNRCTASPECPSTLYAYEAVPQSGFLKPLWSGGIGIATKFARPDPSEGRIYVGTSGHLLAFGAGHHTLTVSPPTNGAVSSDPPGVECGGICSRSYADGASVTLTASPSAGFEFAGWSGDCTGTGPCEVTVWGDISVSAAFVAVEGGGATTPSSTGPRTPIPDTKIVKASIKRHNAVFRFRGTAATAFQCRLIRPGVRPTRRKPAFASCRSPKTYKNLKPGRYLFEVRALNSAGRDPKPAKRRFAI